jgi:hypothetical protein
MPPTLCTYVWMHACTYTRAHIRSATWTRNGNIVGTRKIADVLSGDVYFTIRLKNSTVMSSAGQKVLVSVGAPPRDPNTASEEAEQPNYEPLIAPKSVWSNSDSDMTHQSELALHGNATWSSCASAVVLGGIRGAGSAVKRRSVHVGPGSRFTALFSADLKAEDACLCVLLQAAHGTDASLDADALCTPSEDGAVLGPDPGGPVNGIRSVALVIRRSGFLMTLQILVSGRLLGERVHMDSAGASLCSLCVTYSEGCLAVHSEARDGGRPLLVESVDVCTLLAGDEATMSISSNKSEGDANVLTYWHVCTSHAQADEGVMRLAASGSSDGAAKGKQEGLASILCALDDVAKHKVVREEVAGAAWQDVLWSVCQESHVDEEARGKAMALVLGGLLQTDKEVPLPFPCVCFRAFFLCNCMHACMHACLYIMAACWLVWWLVLSWGSWVCLFVCFLDRQDLHYIGETKC